MKKTIAGIAMLTLSIIGIISMAAVATVIIIEYRSTDVIEQPVAEQPVVEQDDYQYTSFEPRTCDEIVGTSYDTKFIRDGIANGEIMKVDWRAEGWGQTRTVWLYCPAK